MPSHRVLTELTRRYTEPHRHYHDLAHVSWLLLQGRPFRLSEDQVLAIWFHDAVYDPSSETNEEDSARLARVLLEAEGYPDVGIAVVEHIVRDTRRHVPTIEEAMPVIDLDLAPLSVPWEEYRENTRRLRQEQANVDEATLRARERAFCTDFLGRERIYWTAWGRAREQSARRNLERALGELRT